MKRKLAWFGLAFALSELFAAMVPPLVYLPSAALCALLLLFVRKQPLHIPMLGAMAGLLFFGVYSIIVVWPIQQYAGKTVTCTAVVETDEESSYQEGSSRGTLLIIEYNGETTHFKAVCNAFPQSEPGDCFTADFQFSPLEKNSYQMQYKSRNIYLQAEYEGGWSRNTSSRALRFELYRFRQKLVRILRWWMPAQEGELEAAMLLGDKAGLRESLQEAFRTAGVSHLLAVSGLHVALLCGIFSLGRRRRFLRPLIVLRAGMVIFYMFLTGLPVSVMRAGLVFLLALAGDFFLQPVDLLTSTGMAAILLGVQNAYAPCDVGFQLSFCAVVGVQVAGALAHWEQKRVLTSEHETVREHLIIWLLRGVDTIQVAFFASMATMPVLIAHGMTTSGVSVLTNLLVVWMLQPALQLGVLLLLLSCVPVTGPILHIMGLLLTLWLHAMITIVTWCASLPTASIDLPAGYALLVFGALVILALLFHLRKKMIWYLPAAAVCLGLAIVLGRWAQQDVVRLTMVGAANNPCVVCTQNQKAVILFRGGQSNWNAVQAYLQKRANPTVVQVIDLRQAASALHFDAVPVIQVEEQPFYSTYRILDGLTLDLYHNSSGNLAVVGVENRHIAAMAGNISLPESVKVDVFCAAGSLSESVQATTVLSCTLEPAWKDEIGTESVFYGAEEPVIVVRPGRSITLEEVEPLALQ